ncbi:MAG: hypothetical protein WCH32_09520, partial [Pseudomonadota bacterium]
MASQKLRAGIVLAISIAAGTASAIAGAPDLLVRAYGPVDKIEPNGSLSILGTTFELAPNADAVVDGLHLPHAASVLRELSHSDSASVGVLSYGPDTQASRLVVNFNNVYVAGASQVVATGIVRAVDSGTARLWIENTAVDYSAVLSANPEFSAQVGDVVQVLGTRPSRFSMILATRAQLVAPSDAHGISGSGLATATGISGSGKATAHGISGSGLATATGISGSGK